MSVISTQAVSGREGDKFRTKLVVCLEEMIFIGSQTFRLYKMVNTATHCLREKP